MNGEREYSRKYNQMMTPVGAIRKKMPHWAPFFNDEMADFWSGEVVWNGSLAEYTTFKVGGPAEAIVFPKGRNELSLLLQGLRKINVPWTILGKGSNVVVADKGLKGVVIVLGRDFSAIDVEERENNTTLVRVAAGCSLSRLVNWTAEKALGGLEFAVGIPGSVGGAIVMNAGAWNRQLRDVLTHVTTMDARGCFCIKKTSEMQFSYRTWGEERDKIAVEGFFRLKKGDPARIKKRCHEFMQQRKRLQPQNVASAGSFFKNPETGKSAGQLIDEAGLKGYCVGGAMVSEVHANFLINTGAATARDICELMAVVQERVHATSGVRLAPEVKILGLE